MDNRLLPFNDPYGLSSSNATTSNATTSEGISTKTLRPIVMGTSVLAITYRDGVMLAADTLASYGALARWKNVERMTTLGNNTILGASGDYSDFLYTKRLLNSLITEEYYINDGHVLGPPHFYEYLSRVAYNRRSKLNPLWNAYVIAGHHKGERFLGYVDLFGIAHTEKIIATGFGMHYARPILRDLAEGREDTLTEQDATKVLETCMRALWCRDARSMHRIQRAKVTAEGVDICKPYTIEADWTFGEKDGEFVL